MSSLVQPYDRACFLCSIYIYVSIYLPVYLSNYLSIYLSIYQSVCLSVWLSTHLPIHPSIYLSIHLSIYLSVCLSIYLSSDRSIYLSMSVGRSMASGSFLGVFNSSLDRALVICSLQAQQGSAAMDCLSGNHHVYTCIMAVRRHDQTIMNTRLLGTINHFEGYLVRKPHPLSGVGSFVGSFFCVGA